MKRLFAIFLLSSVLLSCKTSKIHEPILFSIGNTQIPTKEFLYVYKKNNSQEKDTDSVSAMREYLDLFINFKLKVKEAESRGMDTTKEFKNEYEGYRKQLAQPYLSDKELNEKMIVEAYERLKTEVNASHILIGLPPNPSSQDTLNAYLKAREIIEKLRSGENFGELAKRFSADSSAKYNSGNLGYFTSMQMVYPFESAAYNTPEGSISEPIKTQFGYHIVKVNDKRPSQGSVQVAHIMLRTNPATKDADAEKIREKALKIHEQLSKGGKSWEEMVTNFSEDQNSKEKNGRLEWFSVGGLVPSFENAAFELKNIGDISAPVQTPYGWHIIKLLDRKGLDSFEKMQAAIKSKVGRDSRSSINKDLFINKLKKEYNFKEHPEAKKAAQSLVDSLVATQKVPNLDKQMGERTLFELSGNKYSLQDFRSSLEKQKAFLSQGKAAADYLKNFVQESVLQFEESQLERKYDDYKMLAKEYREGILLFSLMDENVWSKAVKDSVGLKKYFENNKKKYTAEERAAVVIYSFLDSLDGRKVRDSLNRTFDFLKADIKGLENFLNKKNPLRFTIRRDSIDKENELMSGVQWKTGEYVKTKNGRFTVIRVLNIYKPDEVKFEEIRGQVIADYQKFLEDEWIKELKGKYPVVKNTKELNKIGLRN